MSYLLSSMLCDHSPAAIGWSDSLALMKIFKRKPEGKKCPCLLPSQTYSPTFDWECTFGAVVSDMQGMYIIIYYTTQKYDR